MLSAAVVIGALTRLLLQTSTDTSANSADPYETARTETSHQDLYQSIAGRYRPVRVADGPITDRCRFIKNASLVLGVLTEAPICNNGCVQIHRWKSSF